MSPTRSPQLSISENDIQAQAAESRNESPSASRPVPGSAPSDNDIEAGWSGIHSRRSSRDNSDASAPEAGSSLRELASSVSTVVWRGFDAVRGVSRRSPSDDIDRNR